MNSIKRIREILGLSQQSIADYLGVTRTQVAMSETSRRELPIAALIKMGVLERSLLNNVQYKQQQLQVQAGKDFAAMRHHVKTCTQKARLEKRKLEKLQQKYQCCLQALMAIDYLRTTCPRVRKERKTSCGWTCCRRKPLKN